MKIINRNRRRQNKNIKLWNSTQHGKNDNKRKPFLSNFKAERFSLQNLVFVVVARCDCTQLFNKEPVCMFVYVNERESVCV